MLLDYFFQLIFTVNPCASDCLERLVPKWPSVEWYVKLYLLTYSLLTLVVSVAHWHSARWAWNGYQPGLGSIPRPGRINCFSITGVHALRLISRTGKRVWRCPL